MSEHRHSKNNSAKLYNSAVHRQLQDKICHLCSTIYIYKNVQNKIKTKR